MEPRSVKSEQSLLLLQFFLAAGIIAQEVNNVKTGSENTNVTSSNTSYLSNSNNVPETDPNGYVAYCPCMGKVIINYFKSHMTN